MQIDPFSETQPRAERYAALASIFREPDTPGAYITSRSHPELANVYFCLFQGAGRPLVQPYESFHIEGRLMGAVTDQLLQRYTEAGLQVKTTIGQFTDHISIELAFMAFLVDQEEEQSSRCLIWRARQRRFLNEHLYRWAGTFCEAIQESQVHPFFTQAACATQKLLDQEVHRLTHTKQTKKYPNIRLDLDAASCTLCTLCVDNCRQGALSVSSSQNSLSLIFNHTECNGCRACLRLCPENAITLRRMPPTDMPPMEEILTLISAARAICPRCSQPHIALPWLERLSVHLQGDPGMRASLLLCPVCKYFTDLDVPIQPLHMQE